MTKMDAKPIFGKKTKLLFFSQVTVFLERSRERSLPLGYLLGLFKHFIAFLGDIRYLTCEALDGGLRPSRTRMRTKRTLFYS